MNYKISITLIEIEWNNKDEKVEFDIIDDISNVSLGELLGKLQDPRKRMSVEITDLEHDIIYFCTGVDTIYKLLGLQKEIKVMSKNNELKYLFALLYIDDKHNIFDYIQKIKQNSYRIVMDKPMYIEGYFNGLPCCTVKIFDTKNLPSITPYNVGEIPLEPEPLPIKNYIGISTPYGVIIDLNNDIKVYI